MDAFSRLLATIGQSLGKGLGQVGQAELEQRQRLEVIEAQRKGQVSSQLLQTFTQLLNTQGIQEVEPSGIEDIKKAITDLALGKVDSPNIQRAIAVFPQVASSANKIGVYRELATRDIDALARLVHRADPEEAKKLLNAIGLGGLYSAIRTRGEILTTADELGIQLTKEQIENLATQRRVMEAQIAKWAKEMELTEAQTKQILKTLPLQLTKLQLEIAKGEKELARFDEYLDAIIKGLNLDNLKKEVNIEKLKEEIKKVVLERAKIEAEIEETKARTKWLEAQAENLWKKYNLERVETAINAFKGTLEALAKAGTTDPNIIKSFLSSVFSAVDFNVGEDVLEGLSKDAANTVSAVVTGRDLQLTESLAKTGGALVTAASQLKDPKAARDFVLTLLPKSVSEETRKKFGELAYKVASAVIINEIQEDTKRVLQEPPPPKEREGDVLRPLYEKAVKAFGPAYANGLMSQIKAYWEFQRQMQGIKMDSERAEAAQKKAMALYYNALAATLPEKLALEREEIKIKWEQVRQGWAKLNLEQLKFQAEQSGNQDLIKLVNNSATAAKNIGVAAKEMLASHLERKGHAQCVQLVKGGDPENLASMILGIGGECSNTIKRILDDPNDPVARAFNRSIAVQGAILESIATALGVSPQGQSGTTPSTIPPGGTTTPGMTSPAWPGSTTAPGTTTPGGATPARPGGTTTPGGTTRPGGTAPAMPGGTTTTQGRTLFEPPKRAPIEAGVRQTHNRLFREFGVKRPNDIVELGAMIFVYGNEFGPSYNPFQVTEGSGVQMIEIEITPPNGKKQTVKRPVGDDLGFREVIKADTPGTRKRAMDIDSAIAFGIAWIFPNEARKPRMSVDKIPERFRKANESLFKEANYFKSESGVTDIIALAAAYAARSLKRLGVQTPYTLQYTRLLRLLAEHDLEILTSGRIPSKKESEQAFLDKVERMYGNRFKELRFDSKDELIATARSLFWATRLSEIGNLAIGGVR
jgi:hypothetical protein